jgi:excisionase family DNA binding protein
MGRPEETTTVGEAMAGGILNGETLWTARECAKYLNVSVKTVYRHVKNGVLPCSRLGGTTIRFHPQRVRECAAKLPQPSNVIPIRGR